MLKNNIGFMIPVLENNNFCTHLCSIVKSFIINNKKLDFCIFNQYCEMHDTYNVPLLPISHARYFEGDLFVFDISSLLLSVNFPKTNNIYFFTNSTPWTASYNNYIEWKNIFNKSNVKIISNTKHIHDIYTIAWNNSIGIAENMTYDTIYKCIL